MNNRFIKLTFLALIIAALLGAFMGCAGEDAQPKATEQVSEEAAAQQEQTTDEPPSQQIVNEQDETTGETIIVDVLGNELALPEEVPAKIVSLTPSNTEMLFALGLGEHVVGVDAYSDFPEEALAIEKIGDFSGPNVEAIVALEPEIVFAGNKLQIDAVSQLKDVGLNVAAVEATTYDEIFSSIKLVGDLTMKSGEADEIIAQMKQKEAEIVAKAQDYEGETLSAYYVMFAGESGNWTSGPGSLINDMFEMLQIDVITDIENSAPWMDFSLEKLLAEDPDILLISSMAFITVEDLCAMDGYKELTACKEGRVYIVDATETERASVRIVDGLEEIYNAVYGN
jgi:iron complex transport system substrate-binding protein